MDTLIARPSGGIYVSFEGVEGVGKTSMIEYIRARALSDLSFQHQLTTVVELSQDGLGKSIIDAMGRYDDYFFRCGHPVSEALLFFAMKLCELQKTVLPALESGHAVIEDRSADTNCVYAAVQISECLGTSTAEAVYLQLLAVRESLAFLPDLTFVLVDDLEACICRAESRSNKKYTASERKLVTQVWELYRLLPELLPRRIIKVDLTEVALPERYEAVWTVFVDACSCTGSVCHE